VTIARINFDAIALQLEERAKKSGRPTQDRLGEYISLIRELVEKHKLVEAKAIYDEEQQAGRITTILSTYMAAFELADTLQCLDSIGVEVPVDMMQRVRGGPTDLFEETSETSRARNTMFELVAGAMFARGGMKPVFGKGNQPDLTTILEERKVAVECKRASSLKRFQELLNKAVKQLERKVRTNSGEVGIAAISVTKLFADGNRGFLAENVEEASNLPSMLLNHWLNENVHYLDAIRSKAVSGIIFHLTLPVHVEGVGYTPATDATVFPTAEDSDHHIVDTLAARMRAR
jgi:hypothetical protein